MVGAGPRVVTSTFVNLRRVFVVEPRRYCDPVVARLVDQVQAEYVVRYGGPDGAAISADEFDPPYGLFLVGWLDGDPVATGGWRRLDGEQAEIRRMFVAEPARRQGLGRRMLAALEQTAADQGIGELRLETGTVQPEAIALYESAGYLPAPPFGYYAGSPLARFYRKRLPAASIRPG